MNCGFEFGFMGQIQDCVQDMFVVMGQLLSCPRKMSRVCVSEVHVSEVCVSEIRMSQVGMV